MDDTSLLREYVENGSEPAFTLLVEQHVDLVYSAALRRVGGDHHRAQEIAQMVFTDLARKASQLKTHPLLAGWLHRSTRWAAAGLCRAEQRRIANEQDAALEHLTTRASEPSVAWDQISPLLDDALDALNERDRDAVLLRFFKDQPFAEIGAILGLSENAARMRVERALEKLHGLLTKRGVTSTAAVLAIILTQNSVSAAPAGTVTAVSTTALGSLSATGVIVATAGNIFMSKLQLALAGAVAAALAIGLALQLGTNHRLQAQLAELHLQATTAQAAQKAAAAQLATQQEAVRQLDAALALQAPPLTPEQQERVRLDTIIRKGELDYEYAPLFRQLKLPPEQLDRLKVLIVERNQAIYDAVKLAKSQGLELASPSEEKKVGESATSEIDQRIAALLGGSPYGQFREYIELQPYRMWADELTSLDFNLESIVWEKRQSPEFDAHITQLAQLLAQIAPSFLDDVYRANGWPVDLPPDLKTALAKVLSPEELEHLNERESMNASRRRMLEIVREAALQGKVKLSKSSARDYPASTSNSTSSAK
jgi:RNA polymerase sigma factor (sigma-70 family)